VLNYWEERMPIKLIVSLLSFAISGMAFAADGTITVTPFTAYYGEHDIEITGGALQHPIPLPHHIGCPDQTGVPVETALQNICGAGAKVYYNSIGDVGGAHCGYNVFAGVCVKPQ
jgi:hypothetical protein